MSETIHINDAFGKSIPLLDDHGNLSVEVIMLYTEDKLTEVDRKVVDAIAENDEMTRDALDGYKLTGNPSKTRYHLGQLNSEIRAQTGSSALPNTDYGGTNFNFYRIAATVALLVVVGTGSYFAATYFSKNELADSSTTKYKKIETENSAMTGNEFKATPVYSDSVSSKMGSAVIEVDKDRLDVALNRQELKINPVESDQIAGASSMQKKVDLAVTLEPIAEEEMVSTESDDSESALQMVEEDQAARSRIGATSDGKKEEVSDVNPVETEGSVDFAFADEEIEETLEEEAAEIPPRKAETRARYRMQQAASKKKESDQRMIESVAAEKSRKESQSARSEDSFLMQAERSEMADMVGQEVPPESAETVSTGAGLSIPGIHVAAVYPGGDIALYKFIEKKKNYTEAMQVQQLKGAITVQFEIETDGRIVNARIKTGINGLLNADALRVVRSMTKWKAASENGEPVRSSRRVVIKYGE